MSNLWVPPTTTLLLSTGVILIALKTQRGQSSKTKSLTSFQFSQMCLPLTSPILLLRALSLLRSLVHSSLSASTKQGINNFKLRDNQSYLCVMKSRFRGETSPCVSGRGAPGGCVSPSRSDFCKIAIRDRQLTSCTQTRDKKK